MGRASMTCVQRWGRESKKQNTTQQLTQSLCSLDQGLSQSCLNLMLSSLQAFLTCCCLSCSLESHFSSFRALYLHPHDFQISSSHNKKLIFNNYTYKIFLATLKNTTVDYTRPILYQAVFIHTYNMQLCYTYISTCNNNN